MNDNLPPLPPCAPEFKPRWATDPGGYNKDQMQAYARAAIEHQSVPEAAHTKYLEEIYGYLCSTSPKGYADEAFRNVPDSILPDSVRNRLAEQAPSMGEDARAIPEHAGSQESTDGRDGKTVAARAAIEHQSAAPQPQPVQEPVKGWWAHTCPEDGKVDVVNYQLTPADKRAGWVEHEVYTSQQAQPLSDERVREIYESTTGLHFYRNFARAIEQAHGITKGTT